MLSDRLTIALQYVVLAFLVGWLLVKGIAPGWTRLHSDFSNYYVSARLISEGANIDSLYNDQWFHQQMIKYGADTPGKFSPFPPATAWLMLPLSGLEPLTAQRASVILNLFFIVLCSFTWSRITGWKYLPSLILVLAGGSSLTNNIAFGQVYLVMVTCLMIAVILIEQDRLFFAGILIGVFTAIKYFPIAVVSGLFMLTLLSDQPDRRRYHLTVVYSMITLITLVIVQFLHFGTNIMTDYFFSAFLPHLSSDLSGQGMFSYLFQSWDSLARNLFDFDPRYNPDPVLNWPNGRTIIKSAIVVTFLLSMGFVMYLNIHARPLRRSCVFLSLPALALLVILPASATYHFILILLPLALVVRDSGLTKTTWVLITLYICVGFIPYAMFFGLSEIAGLAFAYPRLWLVTLLFAVTAWSFAREAKQELVQ